MTYYKYYYIGAIAFLVFMSCAAFTVDSFYIEENVIQYYIRASTFRSSAGTARVDFTYRSYASKDSNTTCNFFLASALGLRAKVASACFVVNQTKHIELSDLKMLFFNNAEKSIRYTSKLGRDGLKSLLEAKKSSFYNKRYCGDGRTKKFL